MPANFQQDDPTFGSIDLDDVYVTDQWLIDQFGQGSIYSWGFNNWGQLGLQDVVHRSTPGPIGSGGNWRQISGGYLHALALKADGTLWAWGYNLGGELGLQDTTTRSSPVQIGTDTNWNYITTGTVCSFAIRTNGTLWSWGGNYLQDGILGISAAGHRSSPTQVGSLTNWKFVTASKSGASQNNAFAIKTDGTLWAWGYNLVGGLGTSNVVSYSSPVQVGSLTDWKTISTNGGSTLAVKNDGTLWAWGSNFQGELGLIDTSNRSSPVQVGNLTNWRRVSISQTNTSFAIKTDGTLWAWGANDNGALGAGISTALVSSPIQIGSLTNWKDISSGAAVKTDGTLWTWGANRDGQLGQNTTVHRSSPVQVGSQSDWRTVHAYNNGSFGSMYAITKY